MIISESKLRRIIREELVLTSEEVLPYSGEKSAQGLGTWDQAKYSASRAFLGANPTGARAMATGTGAQIPNTLALRGGVPTIADPAVAAAVSSFVTPKLVDNPIWAIASAFDPTGAMSWPGLIKAWGDYSRQPSGLSGALLLMAILGVIPMVGSAVKGAKLLTFGSKMLRTTATVADAATMAGKLRSVTSIFASAESSAAAIVAEMKASGLLTQLAQMMSKSGTNVVEVELHNALTTAAKVIDANSKVTKYINYVISNSKDNVLSAAVEKMAGKNVSVPELSQQVDKIASDAARVVPGVV